MMHLKIYQATLQCLQDPLQFMAPAMVVTSFDVTKEKDTELALQALKLSLQRCDPTADH